METVKGTALVLRTCNANMTSHNRFTWPKSGPVECPDWVASTYCGNGLHGALWGQGYGALFNWSPDAVWQVVQIEEWIDLDGKVKFPRGIVVHTGNQETATKYITENGASGSVIGAMTATGHCGTATAGYNGTATAGESGTAIAGDYGTAIAGDYGTAIAGYNGAATAGDFGTAIAGHCGTATAGHCGIIQIKHFDGKRYRIKVGYVGEDGIQPNVPYSLDHDGNFIKAVDSRPESV